MVRLQSTPGGDVENKQNLARSGEWLDVCLKNAVIFLSALGAVGLDADLVWNALRVAVSETATWTGNRLEKLAKTWVSLETYQVIENALVAALGHPAHLIKVGRHSPQVSFGFSEALEKWMLKSLIRFITSPRVAIRQVAGATKAFNHNKMFRFVADKPDRCVFAIEYLPGPNGQVRTAEEDSRSLLFYIRGLMESLAPIWPWQGKTGVVKYLTVNARPEALLTKELPMAAVTYHGGRLLVNGVSCGQVIYLRRDPKTDTFLGDWTTTPTGGSIAAVRINRDVTSQCTKTALEFPLLRCEEIYRYETEIPTHIELRWRTNWFFQLVELIPGLLKPLQTGLGSEARTAEAEMAAASERARSEVLRELVRNSSPTHAVADALIDGQYQDAMCKTIALQYDIRGFTKQARAWGVEKTAAVLTQFFERATSLSRDMGFWPYKRVGDALVVIYAKWDRHGDEPDPYHNYAEATEGLIQLASHLHEIASEFAGIKLRIGIASGDVMWHNQTTARDAVQFEGLGDAINWAARLESKGAQAGETVISEELVKLILDADLGTTEEYPRRPNVVVNDEENIACFLVADRHAGFHDRLTPPGITRLRPRVPAALRAQTEPVFPPPQTGRSS